MKGKSLMAVALLLCVSLFFSLISVGAINTESVTDNATDSGYAEVVGSDANSSDLEISHKEKIDKSVIKEIEKQIEEPEKVADTIKDIESVPTYNEAVRTALDEYYEKGSEEDVELLTDNLDERSDTIVENYQNADEERKQDETQLGYTTGEVLVVMKSDVKVEDIPSLIADERMEVICTEDFADGRTLAKIRISYEDTVDKAIEKLSKNEHIDFVQKNLTYKTLGILAEELSNDFYTDQLFHLNAINAPDAWDFIEGVPHEKIKVGIIDTGVQLDHPDLQNVINRDLSVRITSDGIYAPLKGDNGIHGTHVSSIVAGEINNNIGVAGVASAVNNDVVELVEIGSDTGTGSSLSCFVIYKAILYAIDHNIRVINMSLGGNTDPDNIFQSAVDLAVKSGCVVVCAAGNESSNDYHYPSDCNGAVSVIALDKDCKTKADYSNFGGIRNKISAPGTGIIGCVPENSPVYNYTKGYEALSGTSMATPIVTATVGMMLSVNPRLTNSKIKEILYNTADDINTSGYDEETGFGVVNVYKAVKGSYEASSEDAPTDIKISPSRITLEKGGSAKLSASVTATGDYKNVYFHSDDTGVAKIDQDGVISGVATGETVVTACTENSITAKCKVVVVADKNNILSEPKVEPIQTGAYTGARINWEKVNGADYYQLYASSEKNGDYKYIGSTFLTSYSANLGEGGEEVPASNVTFYKIRAISNSSAVTDSQNSQTIAYVYVGQNPTLKVEQIDEQGCGKGMFLHWGAITSAYLYRTDNTTGERKLLETFPENYLTHYYYDTTLVVGKSYTYELKLFTEYDGVEYSEITDSFSFEYLGDDPIDYSYPTGDINKAYYNRDYEISLNYKTFSDYNINSVLCSEDNGKTWFVSARTITSNDGYSIFGMSEGEYEDGKTYLFKYKNYENQLFGTYRTASPYSNVVSVTLPKALDVPKPYAQYLTNGVALINWQNVEDADYYTVYRKDIGTGKWEVIERENTTCFLYDYNVEPGKIYYYRVNATKINPDFKAMDITNNRALDVEINPQVSDYSKVQTLNTGVDNNYIYFADFDIIPEQNYTGQEITPQPRVTMEGKTLEYGVDYSLEYIDNVEAGTAYCKVVGIGEYKGAKVLSFAIRNNVVPKTYNVTYLDDEGSVIEVQKVNYGEKPIEPNPPYKFGYRFIGWNNSVTEINRDTTITACYEKIKKPCKVTFLDKDNRVISVQSVESGESATAPTPNSYSGYEFTGWDKDYSKITHNVKIRSKYKAISFGGGDGSRENPFIISNRYHLDLFSEMVNKNSYYSSACYKITEDIVYNDLADFEVWGGDGKTNEVVSPENIWTPVGNSKYPFRGTLDGGGHTIIGLYTFTDSSDIGLIGYCENAVIKNIGVMKSYFATSRNNVGGIIGRLKATASSKVINCFTRDSYICGSTRSGGLIGVVESENATEETIILNCYSDNCNVRGTWEGEVGGLVAIISTTNTSLRMNNCYAFNTLYVNGGSGTVEECSFGELIGRIDSESYKNTNINNCYCGKDTYPYGNADTEDFSDVFYYGYAIKGIKTLSDSEIKDITSYSLVPFVSYNVLTELSENVWRYETAPPTLYFEKQWYSVSYYCNGELYGKSYYKEGDEITPPVLPQLDNGEVYSWSNLPEIMPNKDIEIQGESIVYGDTNGDGKVSIADVTALQKAIAGLITFDDGQKIASDYNFDGVVDIADGKAIQSFCVKKFG